MTLRPLYDRVVVKRLEAAEKSSGGLYIPEPAREDTQLAEILAVGHGRLSGEDGVIIPLSVKVGDTVLLPKYGGDEITIEEESVLIIREDDILAVVDAQ